MLVLLVIIGVMVASAVLFALWELAERLGVCAVLACE
jgi:hypothetical protein